MDLRLPASASWLDVLVSPPGQAGGLSADLLADVTSAHLDAALAAMQRGDIEFVILEDGDAFVQAAGEGDGPYQLQYAAGDSMHDLLAPADLTTVSRVMHAYLAADPRWRDESWVPPVRA